MAKQKIEKTNAARLLDRAKIAYKLVPYVVDENDLVAVINTDGEIVLPSEYDKIDLIGTFSDDPAENGHGLAARKDGRWYLFNLKGEPLY